jgi:deoxyribodipyrimidine photo-lyase
MKKNSIFWFRRDLRLHDNHGLFKALTSSENVIPIFIFDSNILAGLTKTDKRVSLIYDRLMELNRQMKIYGSKIHIFHGDPNNIFINLFVNQKIDAVFTNTDYEPYAVQRDLSIDLMCKNSDVEFHSFKDQLIFEKDQILSDTGSVYKVYTYYMKKWMAKFKISLTTPYESDKYLNKLITKDFTHLVNSFDQLGFEYEKINIPNPRLTLDAVRSYSELRDAIDKNGTAQISVHLRFGFLSVRELAKIAFQYSETLLKELIWRSFFSQLMWHYPHVVTKCFKPKYEALQWKNDPKLFIKWKYGQTGYPLVDAGMRELFDTGLMKNRVRMLTASFLVKNLGIDWRLGEAYFASKLLDYDLASNNGNWQWVAGTGADSSPYFRVFNPSTQQKKFDPNFIYCKQWLEEMDEFGNYNVSKIVDLKISRLQAIDRYKKCI